MSSSLPNLDLPDYAALPIDSVSLTSAHLQQAAQLSASVAHVDQQWRVYLHALALLGFEQWLEERAPELPIRSDRVSLLQPYLPALMAAVCNLQVGDFHLCLITPGDGMDAVVPCPRAAVELPAFVPHLYVLVEVLEEQELVRVMGYLRADHLQQHQQDAPLTPDPDWTYPLPLDWFELDPDQLLLCLRGLSAAAIARPATKPVAPVAIDQLQAKLPRLRTDWQNPDQLPWTFLTWEEGATLMQMPELLAQFNAAAVISESARAIVPAPEAQSSESSLMQRAINAAHWLQDRLDDVAQELSWILLPTLSPAVGLRSSVTPLDSVVRGLQQQGLAVPSEARGAYRDLHWTGVEVRLYVVVWPVEPDAPHSLPEWTLLTVVGPKPGHDLPPGVRLVVRDNIQTLVEQVFTPGDGREYLYAQVIGSWEEQFWVSVDLTHGAVVTLPPLMYDPAAAA